VVLERANSKFSPVVVMHIWWDKLELGIPLEGDGFLVCLTGLVVKDLEVHLKTLGCQAQHNGSVGGNTMAVPLGLECLLEDEIAIGVEGNHDILIP
jgi:hypothetical protein